MKNLMHTFIMENFFHVRIKTLRESKKIEKATLARYANVKVKEVEKWEQGKTYPKYCELLDIAFELNVDIHYLLCLDDKTYSYLRCLDYFTADYILIEIAQKEITKIKYEGKNIFKPSQTYYEIMKKIEEKNNIINEKRKKGEKICNQCGGDINKPYENQNICCQLNITNE